MASAIVRLAKEFIIKVNGMVIARATDFSLSLDRQVVDVTSFDSAGWVEKISDNKDWNLSFSGLVTRTYGNGEGGTGLGSGTFNNLFDLWVSATGDYPVTVGIGHAQSAVAATGGTGASAVAAIPSGDWFDGGGILVSLNPQGSVGDKMTYSGTIEGAGELSRGTY